MSEETIENDTLPMTLKKEIVDVGFAVEQWEAYQELTRTLLNESDYQKIVD